MRQLIVQLFVILPIDFKDLLGEVIKNNGRDYFNIAPKEQPPETLRQKDRE